MVQPGFTPITWTARVIVLNAHIPVPPPAPVALSSLPFTLSTNKVDPAGAAQLEQKPVVQAVDAHVAPQQFPGAHRFAQQTSALLAQSFPSALTSHARVLHVPS